MTEAARLAISNIAWPPAEARAAYTLLRRYGFTGLEIAPGLAFAGEDDAFAPSDAAVRDFRAELAAHDLELCSMQSLLFGVAGAQLFGSPEERERIEAALGRAIDLAGGLGVPNLVFGSPGNRSFPGTMSENEAQTQAREVFRRLGDRATGAGTRLAIEPNPAIYGTNFLNTVEETARFVASLDHPSVMLNYDIGALIANQETDRAGEIYALARGKVSHAHISEPGLGPAPADSGALRAIVRALAGGGYSGWYSIEMRAPSGDALEQLENALAMTREAVAEALVGDCHA